eukprot:11223980-Lingulodinium_polyedra.AAC.1
MATIAIATAATSITATTTIVTIAPAIATTIAHCPRSYDHRHHRRHYHYHDQASRHEAVLGRRPRGRAATRGGCCRD